MKRILMTGAALLALVCSAADLNPQFLKWRKMKAAGMLPQQKKAAEAQASSAQTGKKPGMLRSSPLPTADDGETGMAPDAASLEHLADSKKSVGLNPWTGCPTRYDLRDEGRVTAVRNQGKFPTCWAFATYGSLESAILSARPDDATWGAADIDFSEKHLVDNHGYDYSVEMGGSMLMSMAYLLRWGGPASEASVPYPAADVTEWTVGDAQPAPRLHVQQVRWIPGKAAYAENDEIKANVMELGGVYVTFYMATKSGDANWARYWNASKAAYYCTVSKGVNHGVTIIGWDDTYPRSNFATMPPGDGAYLVKNSWGSDWGAQGYFWVSYYDRNFAISTMAVFNGAESKGNYATKYEYDELGYTGSHSGNSYSGSAWAANVFTATNDDQIAAVGFYALAPNTRYTVRVKKGLTGANPATGVTAATKEGTFTYAGFYTVPLEDVVAVAAGERFSVETCLYSPGLKAPLAYEGRVPGATSRATAEAEQSWYSSKGTSWTDLSKKVSGANFCIKAYGIGSKDEWEYKDERRPSAIEVTGPRTLAAGATGEFVATVVFDDGYRMSELDIEGEVVEDGGVVANAENDGNILRVTLADSIAADTAVKLRFTFETEEGDIVAEVAFTATQSAPATPTNLTATEGTATSGVRLSWGAVANAATYAVYRSTGGDAANAAFIGSTEDRRYTDLTAIPGVDHTYFVKAQNTAGSSALSDGATGWRALAAPQNLAATDGDFDYVQLTWDASEGANTYCVWRAEDMDEDGNPVNPVQLGEWSEATSLRDTPPEKGKTYFYWVKASLSRGGYRASGWSIFDDGCRRAPVSLSTVQIVGPESVAAGSTASYTLTAVLSDGTRLEQVSSAVWTCSLDGASETAREFSFEALVEGLLVASNTLVEISAEWTYANEDGNVTKRDVKSVVIAPVVPAKPTAPKMLSATTEGVTLEWEPVEGASLYRLYRGETAEAAQLLTVTDELGYMDGKVIPGATYRYWIEAVNAAGTSPRSDASAAAMRQFTPPTYVTATNGKSTDDVTVTWRAVTGARYYRVSRADSPDGDKHDLSGWIADRRYVDATAVPGVTYWYFVEAAYDADGGAGSAHSAPTIGSVSAAQTLAFIEIDGPASIQYDSQGAYVCTATYANGVRKRVQPTWSFKAANPLVTVSASGIVTAGHVTDTDLHLELQASYTDNGVTKTDSFAVTVIAYRPETPSVEVSNVVVRARWPWNGMVDITYDLYSKPAMTRAVVTVSGHDHDLNETLQAVSLSGDGVDAPAAGGTPHIDCRVTWNLGLDYTNFHASAFSVSLDAAPFAVAPPANFRASDGTSTNAVELAWEDAFGAVSYEVWRSLSNNPESAERIACVTNATDYSDISAVPGETYHYWIKTVAGEFEEDVSGFSAPATGRRAAPPPTAPVINLMDGLVAWYPFDGDTLDKSGNNRHLAGYVVDSAYLSPSQATNTGVLREERLNDCASAYVPGYGGSSTDAVLFKGYPNNGLQPEGGSFVVAETFTFAFWVKPGASTYMRASSDFRPIENRYYNTILVGTATTNAAGASSVLAVGENGIGFYEGSVETCTLGYEANLGTNWHHVAFVVADNGAPVLYVDGLFARTGIDSGSSKYLNIDWLCRGGGYYPWSIVPMYVPLGEVYKRFSGTLDEVCIYGKALSPEEVAALYENGKPNVSTLPVCATPTISAETADGVATVSIACAEAGATVWYSIARTDGGATVDSREYTVPFAVDGDATVIAWATKAGMIDSARASLQVKPAWQTQVKRALTDDNAIDWDTSSDAPWTFDSSVTSDGGEGSMRSGAIGANGISTLTATVSGEGTLAFDWKVSSEAGMDFLSVAVDGETVARISGEQNWAEVAIPFTNDATHTVTWTYSKDGSVDRGSDCGWVDYVIWAPVGSSVASPAATVTQLGGGASNRVEIATVTPGATIEYRLDLFGATGEWTAYEGPFVVEGDGEIKMRGKKTGYIDSPVATQTIRRAWTVRVGEALLMDDVTRNAVTLLPDYYELGIDEAYWWDQDRAVVSDGTVASVRSPALDDSEGASIFAVMNGAGTLYFDWKVDSEAGWDVLTYYAGEDGADYAYADSISGDKDWTRVKLTLHANAQHVIEWEYDKDDRGANGADAGWVDYVKWVPARYVPAAPAERRGYEFMGYAREEGGEVAYRPGNMLDGDDATTTFIPVWSPITYDIRYEAQSADVRNRGACTWCSVPDTIQTATYDVPVTLLAATNFVFARGQAFLGWSTNESDTVDFPDGATVMNLAYTQDDEVTLSPVLRAIAYTVRFREGDAQAAADIAVLYGERFTLPTPAPRSGFSFDGWAETADGEVVYAAGAPASNLTAEDGGTVTFYAKWTALPAEDPGDALDQTNLTFRTGGDAPWFVQTATVHKGGKALQSGEIGNDGSSSVETVLILGADRRISFWWKVSSEPEWDTLAFYVNGEKKAEISGEIDWRQVNTVVPAGTNTLRWVYSKDSGGNGGSDCGWLDDVQLGQEIVASGTIFVSAATGNDARGNGSSAKPFATIQMAIDCAAEGRTISVGPGVYGPIVSHNKQLNIVASAGPTNTFIEGMMYGTTNRCATLTDKTTISAGVDLSQTKTVLRYFTLRNGLSPEGVGGGVRGGMLYGCILENNCAMHGAAACETRLINCLVRENWAESNAADASVLRSCIAYSCTVSANWRGASGYDMSYSPAYNSIVWGNIAQETGAATATRFNKPGYVFNSLTDVDPKFVNAARGDFHLQASSPAIDAGTNLYTVTGMDLDRTARVKGECVDLGCYEFDGVPQPEPEDETEGEPMFTVVQYDIRRSMYTVNDAKNMITNRAYWVGGPVTGRYDRIAFTGNGSGSGQFGQDTSVFPLFAEGRPSTNMVCEITGRIEIPEPGWWTFYIGSSGGFDVSIKPVVRRLNDGYTFGIGGDPSYRVSKFICNFGFTGTYDFSLLYFTSKYAPELNVSCLKGQQSGRTYGSLLGTPESGIILVNDK